MTGRSLVLELGIDLAKWLLCVWQSALPLWRLINETKWNDTMNKTERFCCRRQEVNWMEIALLCVVRMLFTCTVLSCKVSVDPLKAPNSVCCGQYIVSGSQDEAYPTVSDLTSCMTLLLDLLTHPNFTPPYFLLFAVYIYYFLWLTLMSLSCIINHY